MKIKYKISAVKAAYDDKKFDFEIKSIEQP